MLHEILTEKFYRLHLEPALFKVLHYITQYYVLTTIIKVQFLT